MAQLLVFIEYRPSNRGVLAAPDGRVQRIVSSDPPKYPRHALWSFIPVGVEEWGMLVNHRDATVLVPVEGTLRVELGPPPAGEDRAAWWRLKPYGPNGHVEIVPYTSQSHSLLAASDGSITLGISSGVLAELRAWTPTAVETSPYVPLPSFDDATIAETFYNLEVVTPRGAAQSTRLYLTIDEEDKKESAIRIGTDPKRTSAQFYLAPVGTGRILSGPSPEGRNPFVTGGRGMEERLYASSKPELAQREVEMINLNGSSTFVSGDRVAMRTAGRFYLAWKSGASVDLTATATTPRELETFVIEKVEGRAVIAGEIKTGDSFALLAGNGRHLTDDRGSADRPVAAKAPHLDAWETFVLGAPKRRSFRIHGKKNGHPVTLGALVNNFAWLLQIYGMPSELEIVERGEGMITLRCRNPGWTAEVVPAGVIEPGQHVGIRGASQTPGLLLRLQAASATPWPDTPDLTMEKYRDPAEDVFRTILGVGAVLGGHALSAAIGIPGGAAMLMLAFDQIYPARRVSQYDILKKFRADILRDVQKLITEHAALQAGGALESAREQYLVAYLNARRAHIHGDKDIEVDLKGVKDRYATALTFLALERGAGQKILDNEKNRAAIKAGLPIYALCVSEFINVLQEIALLNAYQPKLVLPDVWLRRGDQYVTATPPAGVRMEKSDKPLTKAVRLLRRNGQTPLTHGDQVILRSSASTNITAAGGGGGALTAKLPSMELGNYEIFTIERIGQSSSTEIKHGETIALRASNNRHYVSARDGGLDASSQSRGAAETFTIEIPAAKVLTGPPAVEPSLRRYTDAIQTLRTYAAHRYEDARDMFEIFVNDRVSGGNVHPHKTWWHVPGVGSSSSVYHFALSVRDEAFDNVVDTEYTRIVVGAGGSQPAPPDFFQNPDKYIPIHIAVDGYREHMRRVYYSFKCRYFDALRPLLTIADDTQKLCDQMWSDPLMATEYSYAARTTPEHT